MSRSSWIFRKSCKSFGASTYNSQQNVFSLCKQLYINEGSIGLLLFTGHYLDYHIFSRFIYFHLVMRVILKLHKYVERITKSNK